MAEDTISPLLKALDAPQRAAVTVLIKKLCAREKIYKQDVGLFGYSFRSMPHHFAAELFHVTRQSLYDWENDGCPRDADGSYDIFKVHQWLVSRETEKYKREDSLKDKKTQEEIEKLKIWNRQATEEMIPRAEYLEHVRSWAASFRAFWTQTVRKNAHLFVNRTQDEIDVLFEQFGRKLMEVWSGGK